MTKTYYCIGHLRYRRLDEALIIIPDSMVKVRCSIFFLELSIPFNPRFPPRDPDRGERVLITVQGYLSRK